MKVRVEDPSSCIAGFVFVAFGLLGLCFSLDYPMGSATQMGPGYYPFCLSLILTSLGVLAVVRGLAIRNEDPFAPWRIVPLILVLGGVVLFGLFVEHFGLVPAIIALLVSACLTQLRERPIETVVLAAILTAIAVGLFIYGLGMPFTAFRLMA